MIEVQIENKVFGKTYDVTTLITSLDFSDSLNDGCSKLEFSYLNEGMVFPNGSLVRLIYDTTNVFCGYIFSYERSQSKEISAVAYDQIRYLKAKDTMVIKDMRADELIAAIAAKFQLKTGTLANTGYKLPVAVKDNQTYLDMIYEALSNTLVSTKKKFAFYDNYGMLQLTDLMDMRLPLIIGDGSLATGYKYGQSIDENTYNLIKLSRENENTGKREIYIAQDSTSFKQFGMLQYFETVDKNSNPEQIKNKADALLKLMNSETKSMSVDAIGDIRVRAGCGIVAKIAELELTHYLLVKSCKHSFKSNLHTMSLELVL